MQKRAAAHALVAKPDHRVLNPPTAETLIWSLVERRAVCAATPTAGVVPRINLRQDLSLPLDIATRGSCLRLQYTRDCTRKQIIESSSNSRILPISLQIFGRPKRYSFVGSDCTHNLTLLQTVTDVGSVYYA